MRTKQHISIAVLVVFHVVGLVGVLWGKSESILRLTPLNLLLTLGVILVNHVDRRHSWILLLTYILGFLIEVVGVNTGLPFGQYHYGDVLGPQLWNTPLIIGVNWLILLYGANSLARHVAMTAWAQALVAAGLMVLLDYLIEPVAMRYGFWTWEAGAPPLMNYLGWFGTALALSLVWQYGRLQLNTRIALAVYATELVFFGLLNLIP